MKLSDLRVLVSQSIVDAVNGEQLTRPATLADLRAVLEAEGEAEILAAATNLDGAAEGWECEEWDHNPHHICDHGPPCGWVLSIPLPDKETTHACPPGGGGVTPCCGRTPFELPMSDRMTTDSALVTCLPDKETPNGR